MRMFSVIDEGWREDVKSGFFLEIYDIEKNWG